jgi:hypothetical protein
MTEFSLSLPEYSAELVTRLVRRETAYVIGGMTRPTVCVRQSGSFLPSSIQLNRANLDCLVRRQRTVDCSIDEFLQDRDAGPLEGFTERDEPHRDDNIAALMMKPS